MRSPNSAKLGQFQRSCRHPYRVASLAPRQTLTIGRSRVSPGASWRRHGNTYAALAAPSQERPQTPRSIHDVDNGHILGFSADLAEDHPGFHDAGYKQRRYQISQIAKTHQMWGPLLLMLNYERLCRGEPIPRIDYTEEETRTWGTALNRLKDLYPLHACREFNAAFKKFGFSSQVVPQLEDISCVIQRETGWQLRPVAGLMHPRDFLNGLAFRTFHSTQYMRHHSNPMYTPEPDLVHELLGHVALLADPEFCRLMQTIGLASLGASEKLIWHLTKVYWYTVEFGVVYEDDSIKAFGAGILSSYGELQWMANNKAEILPFDPYSPQPKMSYKDGFQKRYFALESFQKGAQLLEDYAATIQNTT